MQTEHREQIANVIARQLMGDFSDSLTRFSYINGTEDFLQLINNPDYLGYAREIMLINRVLPQIVRRIGDSLQIIDLGPGNGRKAIRILDYLDARVSNYAALDISQQMLNAAQLSQSRIRSIPMDYRLCDFTNAAELRRSLSHGQNRLFLLLGNTLTNEIDIESFLRNFRAAIGPGCCYLLIGIELLGADVGQIVREYRNEENYALTFRPLEMLGVNRRDGIIDIAFNGKLGRIEEQFIFTMPLTANLGSSSIRFEKEDRILLSVTHKPTLNGIIRLIRNSTWSIETIDFEENQAMLLLSSS